MYIVHGMSISFVLNNITGLQMVCSASRYICSLSLYLVIIFVEHTNYRLLLLLLEDGKETFVSYRVLEPGKRTKLREDEFFCWCLGNSSAWVGMMIGSDGIVFRDISKSLCLCTLHRLGKERRMLNGMFSNIECINRWVAVIW